MSQLSFERIKAIDHPDRMDLLTAAPRANIADHPEKLSGDTAESGFFLDFALKGRFWVLSVVDAAPGEEPTTLDLSQRRGAHEEQVVISEAEAIGPESLQLARPPLGGHSAQRVVGNPRLTSEVEGSGQRVVTTFERVKNSIPAGPYMWVSPKSESFHPPKE